MILRKSVRNILIAVSVMLALIIINFIPAFSLREPGMRRRTGRWIDVYYQKEEAAALDVFSLLEAEAPELATKFGTDIKVNLYVYDHQKVMQRKRYGLIASLIGLDWYIGDNLGKKSIILTSPASPPPCHDYNSIKYSAPHELVHAYIASLNPHICKWLTEGTALYLCNGEPFDPDYLNEIPSFEDTKSNNPIRFSRINGYQFAGTYIGYLDETYGWDAVLELIRTEDYPQCFGKSQKKIYQEWVHYLRNTYSSSAS